MLKLKIHRIIFDHYQHHPRCDHLYLHVQYGFCLCQQSSDQPGHGGQQRRQFQVGEVSWSMTIGHGHDHGHGHGGVTNWRPPLSTDYHGRYLLTIFTFRTSLANQKQRLLKQTQVSSFTSSCLFDSNSFQLNNQFDAQKVQVDLKTKEEEKTKKKSFLGVLRKISFRTRKTSKEEPSSPPPAPASPPLLLEVPPPPLELAPPPTPPPSPVVTRTPVPSDSPLLQKAVPQVASHPKWIERW